jgi:ribosome-associated translation inhibitor RaiA
MIIQINTDHNISKNEKMDDYFKSLIADSLKQYGEHITRIEVHFKDENGNKEVPIVKSCILEARLEGRQPIAVTAEANTMADALNNAIKKMDASLKAIMEQLKNHH